MFNGEPPCLHERGAGEALLRKMFHLSFLGSFLALLENIRSEQLFLTQAPLVSLSAYARPKCPKGIRCRAYPCELTPRSGWRCFRAKRENCPKKTSRYHIATEPLRRPSGATSPNLGEAMGRGVIKASLDKGSWPALAGLKGSHAKSSRQVTFSDSCSRKNLSDALRASPPLT